MSSRAKCVGITGSGKEVVPGGPGGWRRWSAYPSAGQLGKAVGTRLAEGCVAPVDCAIAPGGAVESRAQAAVAAALAPCAASASLPTPGESGARQRGERK